MDVPTIRRLRSCPDEHSAALCGAVSGEGRVGKAHGRTEASDAAAGWRRIPSESRIGDGDRCRRVGVEAAAQAPAAVVLEDRAVDRGLCGGCAVAGENSTT